MNNYYFYFRINLLCYYRLTLTCTFFGPSIMLSLCDDKHSLNNFAGSRSEDINIGTSTNYDSYLVYFML